MQEVLINNCNKSSWHSLILLRRSMVGVYNSKPCIISKVARITNGLLKRMPSDAETWRNNFIFDMEEG